MALIISLESMSYRAVDAMWMGRGAPDLLFEHRACVGVVAVALRDLLERRREKWTLK